MSIFIILVLCFVYFYCSALERAMGPTSLFEGGEYYASEDYNRRSLGRYRHYSNRVWDLSKFK